jgi:hypothetical protein
MGTLSYLYLWGPHAPYPHVVPWTINATTFYPKPRVYPYCATIRADHFFAPLAANKSPKCCAAPLPNGLAARLDPLFATSVSWTLPLLLALWAPICDGRFDPGPGTYQDNS